jgi:hypothetical protein
MSSVDEMGAPWTTNLEIKNGDWRNAQEWVVKTQSRILTRKDGLSFNVPSTSTMKAQLCKDELKECCAKWRQKIEPLEGENYDSYRNRRGAFYHVRPLQQAKQKSSFVLYSCSCVQYHKYAFCKHSLGIGYWKGR